jgi:hypothetical protein
VRAIGFRPVRSSSPRSGRARLASSLWLCLVSVLFLGPLSPESAPAALPGEPPDDDPAAWLFSPDSVVEIDFTLPQESIDALNADPDEYQNATFSLTTASDEYGPLDVGVRLKGKGSFRPLSGKAAFKVKMSHSVPGQRFLGLKTLTLNNMVQDPSMIHELLAYRVFRSAGVAAPRTGYAYVRVNDQDYGLYLDIETPDSVMLPRWFESTQHLYEGEWDENGGVDVTPPDRDRFSIDEGSKTDLTDLDRLIAAVNSGTGDWSDRVSRFADLQQMTRMWAVERYIGDWDSYSGEREFHLLPNNYYLHSDTAGGTGIFSMLPWGTDQTWSDRLRFDGTGGVMFDECLNDASCFVMYHNAVRDVRALIAGLDLDTLADDTAALLEPWQEQDPRREYSLEEIDAAVDAIHQFLADRGGDADAWLDTAPPTTADDVDAAPHTSPVTVTLSANDGGGLGIDKTYYTIGSSPSDPTTSSAVYDPADRPTLRDGERIKYFSTDLAGNTEAVRTSAAANAPNGGPVTTPEPLSEQNCIDARERVQKLKQKLEGADGAKKKSLKKKLKNAKAEKEEACG